jgi:hypothetical protein
MFHLVRFCRKIVTAVWSLSRSPLEGAHEPAGYHGPVARHGFGPWPLPPLGPSGAVDTVTMPVVVVGTPLEHAPCVLTDPTELALGHAPQAVDRVACPIGLPLGRSTPAEIAISVAAQLIQVRDA